MSFGGMQAFFHIVALTNLVYFPLVLSHMYNFHFAEFAWKSSIQGLLWDVAT
jgi:hypothetical protein